jgi:glutamyl/glutaminyl-tRNA synthetase
VFTFSAAATLANPDLSRELREPGATAVARALAEELANTTRLVDKDTFRAAANRVKDKTGQKGKALFHPIRLILTGAAEGPELDLIVPAIERATGLPGLAPVTPCRDRATSVAGAL